MEKKNIVKLNPGMDTTETAEDKYLVKLRKEYDFEGRKIKEIDLSGLEDLTGENMIAAEKYLASSGVVAATAEMSIAYCFYIASVASGIPLEFFKRLSPKDAVKVKTKVTSFFYNEG